MFWSWYYVMFCFIILPCLGSKLFYMRNGSSFIIWWESRTLDAHQFFSLTCRSYIVPNYHWTYHIFSFHDFHDLYSFLFIMGFSCIFHVYFGCLFVFLMNFYYSTNFIWIPLVTKRLKLVTSRFNYLAIQALWDIYLSK